MSAQFCAPSWVTFDNGTIHLDLVELSAMELQLSFVSFFVFKTTIMQNSWQPQFGNRTERNDKSDSEQEEKGNDTILWDGARRK